MAILVYVVVGCVCYLLYLFIKFFITYILKKNGNIRITDSGINTISSLVLLLIIGLYLYFDIREAKQTSDFEISNFKFEKSIVTKTPDMLENNKVKKKVLVFYSFDLVNKNEAVQNFMISAGLSLKNFNNMDDNKVLNSQLKYFDKSSKEIGFNDVRLFKENEIIKVYGSIIIEDENLVWFTQNIPFEPEISFMVMGGTSEDSRKYGLQNIVNDIDISTIRDLVVNALKDPNTINLEYYIPEEYASLKLKNSKWSNMLKQRGKRDDSEMNDEEIFDILIIK
ncbi:hypothetical protein [Aquirufa sp.]|jgi:hypothetical protein|uniref:hypothetical protein n=1 Tax=Aquirufa sp. TaxID=2676249 RepID=UPI00378359D6